MAGSSSPALLSLYWSKSPFFLAHIILVSALLDLFLVYWVLVSTELEQSCKNSEEFMSPPFQKTFLSSSTSLRIKATVLTRIPMAPNTKPSFQVHLCLHLPANSLCSCQLGLLHFSNKHGILPHVCLLFL